MKHKCQCPTKAADDKVKADAKARKERYKQREISQKEQERDYEAEEELREINEMDTRDEEPKFN